MEEQTIYERLQAAHIRQAEANAEVQRLEAEAQEQTKIDAVVEKLLRESIPSYYRPPMLLSKLLKIKE